MTFVLPDTSVWLRVGDEVVAQPLAAAVERDRVLTNGPVVLELLRSAQTHRELVSQGAAYDELRHVHIRPSVVSRARAVQRRLAERGYHRGPSPVDLLTAAAAESVGAELWHCDRHFELIGEVTGQPMRRVGE